jgi:signal transduction histidine kinase
VATGDDRRFAQLVAVACHDLRNPLATVFGFARTLTRTELDERAARYIGMIDAASNELGELLDELSLVARVRAGASPPSSRRRTPSSWLARPQPICPRIGSSSAARVLRCRFRRTK